MDIGVKLIMGSVLIGYGLYYLMMRKFAPEKLTRLESMKYEFGDKKALRLHTIGHMVIPFVAGIIILAAHFRS